jgi:biotin carboxylase
MEYGMDGLFLVLEPGNHMFKVIEAAHRRGLTVVVCHSQPVAPSGPFAAALACISHFVKVEGWRNEEGAFEAIVAWCGDRPVRGTYAGFEITLRMEARLRQHYGLRGSYPEQLDFLLNKVRVRETLRNAGLTKLRTVEDRELRELTEWPFPGRAAFLKPINGSGSTYVRRCTTLADVREHMAEWDGNVRHIRRFIADYLKAGLGMFLEEEGLGELLSLEGYCHDGAFVPCGITDRTVLARDVAIEMGNTFPCPHPRTDEIVAKVRAIHECLGISHGPTHTELVVSDQGELELVELNLRFAGGDILILLNRAYGVAFEDTLVSLSIGQGPLHELPKKPQRYVSGQDFLPPLGLELFESIDIPGDDVFFQKVVVKPGTALKSTKFQSDHLAAFVVDAESYVGALARANEVRAATTINGKRVGDDPNNVVINYADRWTSSYV